MFFSVKWRKWSLVVVWFIGILAVILFGFRDNPYLQYVRGIQPPYPYPYKYVGQLILLISIQMGLYWLILRPASYKRFWGRALGAFILSAGFIFWGALISMHAPPAFIAWYYWLIAMNVGFLILTVWSLVGKWKKN